MSIYIYSHYNMNTQHSQGLGKSVIYMLLWKICESWDTLVEKSYSRLHELN